MFRFTSMIQMEVCSIIAPQANNLCWGEDLSRRSEFESTVEEGMQKYKNTYKVK